MVEYGIAGVNWTAGDRASAASTQGVIWNQVVIVRVSALGFLMFLTIIGNTSLILVITCCPRQRRKRVNLFLLNLALGDLMVCFVTMTTEILFLAFGEWVLGAVTCKIVVYLQMVTLTSATFLLTGMSIDRYQVLVQPLRSLADRPVIWHKVVAAWVAALTISLPQLFIFVQTDDDVYPSGDIKHGCRSQGYTAPWQRKVYFTFLTCYILIVPAIIMTFCYSHIINVVWTRTESAFTKKRVGVHVVHHRRSTRHYGTSARSISLGSMKLILTSEDIPSSRRQSLRIPKKVVSASKRKVVQMSLSVVVGFLACWTPYFFISLIRIYSHSRHVLQTPLAVAEIIGLTHSALNPVLYGFFTSRFRFRQLGRVLRCRYVRSSMTRNTSTTSQVSTLSEDTFGTLAEMDRYDCLGCCWDKPGYNDVKTDIVINGEDHMTLLPRSAHQMAPQGCSTPKEESVPNRQQVYKAILSLENDRGCLRVSSV